MAHTEQMAAQMTNKGGFIAALDQSGGSTPGALRAYGIPDSAYSGEAEMYRLMHEMRSRIMTSPAFTGEKVIGAILFERTMDGTVKDKPTPTFLWEECGVVPFVKVDVGLQDEADGVRLMKPIPGLDALLDRAAGLGVYGTKMRSVINTASPTGIAAVVKQQFEIGAQIIAHGLMPIIEPEVTIHHTDKQQSEEILLAEITKHLDALTGDNKVMLKLSIPEQSDIYNPLVNHPRVQRVVALSGGYSRHEACQLLAKCPGIIASFSRALTDGLTASMTDAEFNAALGAAIEEIYQASAHKG